MSFLNDYFFLKSKIYFYRLQKFLIQNEDIRKLTKKKLNSNDYIIHFL
jgi:hypothetical protein